MHKAFDDYFREAVEKGWWPAAESVSEDTRPRVLIVAGGNTLRRVRQGHATLLEHLWPQLQMVVSVDYRMNTTGLFSDIILPAANHYEKVDHHIATPEIGHLTLSDRAVDPPADVKEEWEIFALLAKRLEERAKERGVGEFQDRQGINRRLDNLHAAFTLNGRLAQKEQVVAATLETYRRAGLVPEESDMDRLRQQGFIRFTGWGETAGGLAQAADVEPGKTHAPLLWHVEKKLPYPTLTRRAQFYIDHDWFLEAGEELPCHKDNPSMGGDHPLILTSGHNRWSIHSMNIAEREMLRTHRGRPFAFIHPGDADARGIEDGNAVRLFNDLGSSTLVAKIASGARPGQVIVYDGFESFMFPGWKNTAQLVPGMTKWLHLAGGYGHLRYRPLMWQPQQADRAVRVNMERVRGDADSR